VEAQGDDEHHLVRAAALPVTLGGAARFQVANVLAALAACRAFGLPRDTAARAMIGFDSSQDNHGRMNLYRVERGYVVVDYGHNPGAFEALCGLTAAWPDRRVTGIFTAPGDREDGVIEDVGRTAARAFDRLIIREDEDLRGRRPGEVAELLCQAARAEEPDKECRHVPGEAGALRTALEEMEEGEVVVFFYEKNTEPCLEVLRDFGGRPVNAIEPRAALQPA
jgi:cyanophycin synthetase